MGPKAPSKANSEYTSLLSDFQVVEKRGEDSTMVLRRRPDSKEYFLRQLTFNDQSQFQSQLQAFKKRRLQIQPCLYILHLQKIVTHTEDQFCSAFFKMYTLMEWESRSLDVQINQRNLQKRRFQEKQLWSIASSCIIALSSLQKQSIKHQSLSSSSIFLTQEGSIRIYDPFILAHNSNYDTVISKRNTPHIYLSPQQVNFLESEDHSPVYNSYKGDVWTLGMILMQCGLCKYQDECYRDQWSRIHWETLQFNVNRLKQIYSRELSGLVEVMLSSEEVTRPDWMELEERLLRTEQSRRQSARTSNASNQSDRQKVYQKINYPVIASRANQHIYSTLIPRTSQQQYSHLHVSKANNIPANTSIIDQSRPYRSIFPTPLYTTETRIDQNLIYLSDQYSQLSEIPNRQESYFNSLKRPNGSPSGQVIHKQASAKAFTPFIPSQNININDALQFVVERYRQGSEYRGQKWRNMRHSHGVFLYLDGGKYEGDWCFNKMEGHGCLYYQSGKLAYDGQWADDKFSGKGILYNEQPQILQKTYNYQSLDEIEDLWIRYQGQFKADLKNGKGTLYISNGQYFQGIFLSDIAQGIGKYTKRDGGKIDGRWSGNKLIELL